MSSLVVTDYGTDIVIGKTVSLVSGTLNLINAVYRRLQTPRGGLFYDPNYGEDVRLYLNGQIDTDILDQIKVNIEQQVQLDARVRTATATVTFNSQAYSLRIILQVVPIVGQSFTLVLSVDKLSVTILANSLQTV